MFNLLKFDFSSETLNLSKILKFTVYIKDAFVWLNALVTKFYLPFNLLSLKLLVWCAFIIRTLEVLKQYNNKLFL